VLVAGGTYHGAATTLAEQTSAEAYDPGSGAWRAVASMNGAHDFGTATLLPDGRVLVAGGIVGSMARTADAELYDPAADTWTPTASMATPRANTTATLLINGRVIVAGGLGNTATLASAEAYGP
jgi:N-acetylneuraminic acid mutarotase